MSHRFVNIIYIVPNTTMQTQTHARTLMYTHR